VQNINSTNDCEINYGIKIKEISLADETRLAFEIEEADDASITHSGASEEKIFVRGIVNCSVD